MADPREHPVEERVTLWRWVGDGMPPSEWRSDVLREVAADGSDAEVQEFVAASRLEAVEAERDSLEWQKLALLAEHNAAEARAEKAEEALREAADEFTNGVTANLSFIEQLIQKALADLHPSQPKEKER